MWLVTSLYIIVSLSSTTLFTIFLISLLSKEHLWETKTKMLLLKQVKL